MAFTKIFVAAVAVFSLATSVAAAPVAKAWDESKFEPYDIYHARYNALDCKNKHNTKFFDTCCGPLAHGQALSTRPAECNPAKTASTGTQADDGDDDECDDGDDEVNTVTLNPTTTKKATTTTKKATTTKTTTKTPAATKVSTTGSTHTGHGTWYTQDNTAGACGKKHPDSALIGAMNFHLYGNVDKVSSTCGKKVEITNKKNGKKVQIVIADACPTCPGSGDIDLSRGAFKALESDFGVGVLDIAWQYVS